MARTRVARTRLTDAEYADFEKRAKDAGVSTSEYLRDLIAQQGVSDRLTAIERRLTHVESEIARMWAKEGSHDQQVS